RFGLDTLVIREPVSPGSAMFVRHGRGEDTLALLTASGRRLRLRQLFARAHGMAGRQSADLRLPSGGAAVDSAIAFRANDDGVRERRPSPQRAAAGPRQSAGAVRGGGALARLAAGAFIGGFSVGP